MTDETDTLPPPRKPNDTHDFAGFVRILGRGPGRSRSLTRAEARYALGMVLRGEATREQIGALLMLLRYRGEAIQEATGLVEAARTHAGLPWNLAVDLDWPSYADGRTLIAGCGHLEAHYRSVPPKERRESGEIQLWSLDADR